MMLKSVALLCFVVVGAWARGVQKADAGDPILATLEERLEAIATRGTAQDFVDEVIEDHNNMRAIHQVEPLTEDPSLTATAQAWAETLADTGAFKHNKDRGNCGENIAYSSWSGADGAYFSQLWYSEVKDYADIYGRNLVDFNEFYKVGHFTQLVWKGTKKIGVGKATKNGRTYVVANYSPPGNYWNQFDVNVLEPVF